MRNTVLPHVIIVWLNIIKERQITTCCKIKKSNKPQIKFNLKKAKKAMAMDMVIAMDIIKSINSNNSNREWSNKKRTNMMSIMIINIKFLKKKM